MPKVFGWQHLTFLAVYLCLAVAAVLVVQFVIRTEKRRTVFLKCTALVLLVFIVINRIALAVWHKDAAQLLPNSYCGITGLLLALTVLFARPNAKLLHLLMYVALVGDVAALAYPNFLGQAESILFLPTISGLIHHGVCLLLAVLLLQTKRFSPSIRRWKVYPIGISIYTLYGLFLLDVLHVQESMYIDAPCIAGTPLKWWFFLLVGSAGLAVFLLVVELLRIRRNIRNTGRVLRNLFSSMFLPSDENDPDGDPYTITYFGDDEHP